MNRDVLQDQLNAFYEKTLSEAIPALISKESRLSFPFLLDIPTAYLAAPVRIMFVGKETNGWNGRLENFSCSSEAIGQLVKKYQKYRAGPSRSPFTRTLIRTSKALYGDLSEALLWNNLMKMDWNRGRTDSRSSIDHSQQLSDLSAKLLRFEVDLLKPDVIIFASGASYDKAIKTTFRDYKTEVVIEKRCFWVFKIGHTVCYRVRHPGARSGGTLGSTSVYYSKIVADVKSRFPLLQRPGT